jgi:hypothetical protein
LRGARDLAPADGHVAAFLDETVAADDPVRLGDALVLLTYAAVAFAYRRTALMRAQLTAWVLIRVCLSPDPSRMPQAAEPLELPDACAGLAPSKTWSTCARVCVCSASWRRRFLRRRCFRSMAW